MRQSPAAAAAAAACNEAGDAAIDASSAVWPIHSVTMLARFFSSEPRRPKSLLCGTKFHLQRAQEALSVEHLVASTDIFYGSFPEVAPDARRHATPPPLLFKNTSSISDSKRGPHWLIFRQALRSYICLETIY